MAGVSVIIPTYNREKLLHRALTSVIQQRLSCDEIIVVDDGSVDNSRGVVQQIASQSAVKVRYIYQENKGPAAARNRGIKEARYEYLAFLDSDDHWQKKKLTLQVAALNKNPGYLISHTGERWLRRGKHLNQKKKHQPGHGDIFQHCLQLCAVGMSTVMVQKIFFERVGLFNEDLRCCEDYDLWLRSSCRLPFLLVDQPLTVKEGGRDDQVSFQYRVGMDKLRILSIKDLLDTQILSQEQESLACLELRRKSLVYGRGCVKHGRAEEGKIYLDLADWAEQRMEQ
jgi:glycosyltransferase involved in cell wall biosynthesis